MTLATRVDDSLRARVERGGRIAYGAAAAGLGVLCLLAGDLAYVFQPVPRWMPALAAVLEAAQITAFVVLAHIPAVCGAPGDRVQWAMMVYAAVISASVWLVAATLGDGPGSWAAAPLIGRHRGPRRAAVRARARSGHSLVRSDRCRARRHCVNFAVPLPDMV